MMKTLLLAACILLCAAAGGSGQTLRLFDVDHSAMPTITAKVFAFGTSGEEIALPSTGITLTENGAPRTITSVTCPPRSPARRLSSVLTIDISISMISSCMGSESRLEMAQAAAREWIRLLPLGQSECAITTFDAVSMIAQDFTTDRNLLVPAVNGLLCNPGTNHMAGLASGLSVASRGAQERVLLFITDGISQSPTDVQAVVDAAKAQNCKVFVVTICMPCPQELQQISAQTGGQWFESVSTMQEIMDVYRHILGLAQGYDPCTVTWTTDVPCGTTDEMHVELSTLNTSASARYRIPAERVPSLVFTPESIYFSAKPPGNSYPETVNVTATGKAFTVTGITSSNPDYTITPTSFTLPAGGSRTLTVTYTPRDSGYTWTQFTLATDICQKTFFASGSFPGRKPSRDTVTLTTPNGGEVFAVGADTVITWTGISAGDTVSLEFSSDNGSTWHTITDAATGLQHTWHRIPGPPSTKCRIRLIQYEFGRRPSNEEVRILRYPAGSANSVSWSPDGNRVVTGSDDHNAYVWDVASRTAVLTLRGHTQKVTSVDWSPDGLYIATAGYDADVHIWDAFSGAPVAVIGGLASAGYAYCVAWSPDNRKLAVGFSNGSTDIIDVASRKREYSMAGHTAGVWGLAWSNDNTRLATAGQDGTVRIWLANGTLQRTISAYTGYTYGVSWSPDNTKLLTGGSSKQAHVWDAATGALLFGLDGHTLSVQGVAWSPSGSMLATSSDDNTAITWNASTGKRIQRLVGHEGSVWCIAWSTDGTKLATSSSDSSARIWHVSGLPIQSDECDNMFSTVVPRGSIADMVDMGRVVVGAARDSMVVAYIHNTSSIPLRIDSVVVTGAMAGDFSTVSNRTPFVIPAQATVDVEFGFRPSAVGPRKAQVLVYTRSDTLAGAITGIGVLPDIEVVTPVVDFDTTDIENMKFRMDVATITNVGTQRITITATRHVGPVPTDFGTQSGAGPFTLGPGDTATMSLFFAPSRVGRTTGRLLFDYDGAASPATIILMGEATTGRAAIAATTPAEFRVLCNHDALDTVVISNIGGQPLVISGASIGGPQQAEFALETVLEGTTVSRKGTSRAVIRYTPQATGTGQATLTIHSNSIVDSVLEIPLSGRKDSLGFTVMPTPVDIGYQPHGTVVDVAVEVHNTGTLSDVANVQVPFNATIDRSRFALPAGGSDTIRFRYRVDTSAGQVEGVLVITDSVCGRIIEVPIRRRATRPIDITVGISSGEAYAGENIDLPIVLTTSGNLDETGATGFTARIRVNSMVLLPISPTPIGTIRYDERIIDVTLPLHPDANGVLGTLHFIAALGMDSTTRLVLEHVEPIGGQVNVAVDTGTFRLLDICREGGPRLVNPNTTVELSAILPNPVRNGQATVTMTTTETGPTSLTLKDLRGTVVTTFIEGTPQPGTVTLVLDVSAIPSGTYYLILQTPTELRTVRMDIVR